MRHTMDMYDVFFFIKNIIGNISVGLKIPFEVFQNIRWSFTPAAFLVIEKNYFINTVLIHSVITTVCFTLFVFVKYFDGRFVSMKVIALH